MMLLGSITKNLFNIQIIDGSRDAHYKLLFDDSAFLFNQREKSFVVYWVPCTLIDMSVKLIMSK